MSKTKAMVLVGAILMGIAASAVMAEPARCAWCPSFRCFNSAACGPGCVCITPPGEMGGNCYGID